MHRRGNIKLAERVASTAVALCAATAFSLLAADHAVEGSAPSVPQLFEKYCFDCHGDGMKKGKVAFFNTEKGYGFITDSTTSEKYFVHVNGLLEQVKENDTVTFELERGLKGMNAVRVKKA